MPGTMFCPYCGQNNEQASVEEAGKTSSNIADEIEKDQKSMPEAEPAGERSPDAVDATEQKSMEAVEEEEQQDSINKTEIDESVSMEEEDPESEPALDIAFCESCGFKLEPGDMFCPDCGHKTEAQQTAIHSFHDEEEKAKTVCPVCRTEIEEDALFCIECGYKLG